MKKIMFLLSILIIFCLPAGPSIPGRENNGIFNVLTVIHRVSLNTAAWAESGDEKIDIQWFKDEMKISPKYIEAERGVMGVSWAHFFTMVLLFAYGAGTLIIFILRYRRTKELINLIREGIESEPKNRI